MTDRKGPAVLIHYDEQTDCLYLSTVRAEKLSLLDAEALGHGIDIATFRQVDAAEAERRIGAGVLTLLNSLSGGAVGIRDYDQLHQDNVESHIAELRPRAEAGDAEAQYDLHHLLFTEAMSHRSIDLLSEAERFLRLAAASGHVRAIGELDDWPILKRQVERRARKADT